MSQRIPSISVRPDTTEKSRSRSASLVHPQQPARAHADSVSSITSTESESLSNIVQQDSNPYFPKFGGFTPPCHAKLGKIKLLDDIDIEKQLIITAGGRREYVCGFILKLLVLMLVVLGSAVLIFYAL